jgi:hypothetical protein
MYSVISRKISQVVGDPVLRRWLVGRLLCRNSGAPSFQAHQPSYIAEFIDVPRLRPDRLSIDAVDMDGALPRRSQLVLPLAGLDLGIVAGAEAEAFDRNFEDTESLLGLHRFAWIPFINEAAKPGWVDAMWRAWLETHAEPNGGWPWHPYTVVERAINILNFSARYGVPGETQQTLNCLYRHAEVIADGLEYWGDHNTSNHLANNGRGLYLIGLALELDWASDLGRQILLREAGRIFLPSGVLREGSSHYHLLYVQRYLEVWLAAQSQTRPEADEFREIAARGLAVLPHFEMPGGFPLVGDISPDSQPSYLTAGFSDQAVGWMSSLTETDRAVVASLEKSVTKTPIIDLMKDGWFRHDHGQWSMLGYAAPDGWPPMPGHGHQDCGSFELHFGNDRVIVDPGRGAYGNGHEAMTYYTAAAHNLMTVDGEPPFPDNRPYYDDEFRNRVCHPAPGISRDGNTVLLSHGGYARFRNTGTTARTWSFEDQRVIIFDGVEGNRHAEISRAFHVCHPTYVDEGVVMIEATERRFKITCDGLTPTLEPAKIWTAYGENRAGTRVSYVQSTDLPWSGSVVIEEV